MTYGARLVRGYGEADWLARLILTTCFAAALNFGDCFLMAVQAAQAAGTLVAGGSEVCYFGPPPAFYPRLIVSVFLLVASLFAFKPETLHRVMSAASLAGALGFYVYFWVYSYDVFQDFQMMGIDVFNHLEVSQTAYLYDGSWLDLLVALAIIVCLTLVLDRLFDGEKPENVNG